MAEIFTKIAEAYVRHTFRTQSRRNLGMIGKAAIGSTSKARTTASQFDDAISYSVDFQRDDQMDPRLRFTFDWFALEHRVGEYPCGVMK